MYEYGEQVFISHRGNDYKKAGIPHLGKQRGLRVHDLRHTFCVKTLVRLAREGKDLYYIMPILSMYIGHLSLKATDRICTANV